MPRRVNYPAWVDGPAEHVVLLDHRRTATGKYETMCGVEFSPVEAFGRVWFTADLLMVPRLTKCDGCIKSAANNGRRKTA